MIVFEASRALKIRQLAGLSDCPFRVDVSLDASRVQNARARSLLFRSAAIATADIRIWPLHRDPKT